MGQSKKMIATDLKTDLKKATLPVLLLAALGWYSATRAHIPAASTVDGVYSNPCCGKFVLRNGVVEIGSSRVPFYLASMKFGLTAYPTQEILVRSGRVEATPDADPGPLSFSENGTVVTVCGDRLCNQVYAFKRGASLEHLSDGS